MPKIYKFHVELSEDDEKVINNELYKANKLWNRLVEIFNIDREIFLAWKELTYPEIKDMNNKINLTDKRINDLIDAAKKNNIKSRQKVKDENLKNAKDKKKALISERAELRKQYNKKFKAVLRIIEDNTNKLKINELLKRNKISQAEAKELQILIHKEDKNKKEKETISKYFTKLSKRTIQSINYNAKYEFLADNNINNYFKWKICFDQYILNLKNEALSFDSSNLSSGTYLAVADAFKNAVNEFKKGKRGPPKFHRFDGTGRVAVAPKIKNFTFEQILQSKFNELTLESPLVIYKDKKTGKVIQREPSYPKDKRNAISKGKILVAKKGRGVIKNDGVFVDISVLMSKNIPKDAKISQAWLLVERVGPKRRNYLELTIDHNDLNTKFSKPSEDAIYGDIGWRIVNDGILVCTFKGTDNKIIRCILPPKIKKDWKYVEEHQSIIDKRFNNAKDLLLLIKENFSLSEEILEEIKFIKKWRNPAKLAKIVGILKNKYLNECEVKKLWYDWKNRCNVENKPTKKKVKQGKNRKNKHNLLPNNYDILDNFFKEQGVASDFNRKILCLEWWRKKNAHLYERQAFLRRKAINARENFYRKFFKDLRCKYKYLGLGNLDLNKMSKKEETGENKKERPGHDTKLIVAPGEFREIGKEYYGKNFIAINERNTSKKCSYCKYINTWDDNSLQVQKCKKCCTEFDRDENAASNGLSIIEREQSSDVKNMGTARSDGKAA